MGSLVFEPAAEAWGVGAVLVVCALFSLAGTKSVVVWRWVSRLNDWLAYFNRLTWPITGSYSQGVKFLGNFRYGKNPEKK